MAGLLEAMLSRDDAAFDDIEGPLLYVHMLSLIAQERALREIDRDAVARWKDRYLHIFNSTIGAGYPDYVAKRREVIAREFDLLATRLPEPAAGPPPTESALKPAARKRAKKGSK